MATTSATTTTSSTTGSLSSLGLGSGVLTSDVLDKLRAADESGLVKPIDTKLTANTTKQTDLASILSLANTLKSSTNTLSDENNYLKRTTTVSNDAISVTASGGASVENFTMHVNTLAKQDIYQSTNFSSQTSSFTSANDTLNLKIGTNNYSLDVTSSTSLSDLKNMINDKAGGKVTASILNVGGTNPYRLVIKSASTGANNAITLSSTGTGTAITDLGLGTTANHLQTATDASFVYNGITINRSSNTVTDLISGLSLTLNKEQTDAATNTTVAVTQDWTNITTNLKSLVSGYNDLMTKLKSTTTYDTTAKTAGTFQGVTQVSSLSSAIRKEVLSVDSQGRGLSAYGISMDSTGVLSFDSTAFNAKVAANPADVKDYFQGSTTYSATSYKGSAVTAGALSIGSNAFSINGKAITLSTGASATTADNLAAIKTAINNAGLSGITASIGSNNNIVLKGVAGADIVITGDTAALSSLGLQSNNVYSSPIVKDGIFTTFNSIMNGYVNTTDGTLTQYNTSLTTLKTALTTSRATAVSRLDTKYNAMATKFAAYDSMISKLTNQFSSLSTIIKQSTTSK